MNFCQTNVLPCFTLFGKHLQTNVHIIKSVQLLQKSNNYTKMYLNPPRLGVDVFFKTLFMFNSTPLKATIGSKYN